MHKYLYIEQLDLWDDINNNGKGILKVYNYCST